jgi:hypothetical protein
MSHYLLPRITIFKLIDTGSERKKKSKSVMNENRSVNNRKRMVPRRCRYCCCPRGRAVSVPRPASPRGPQSARPQKAPFRPSNPGFFVYALDYNLAGLHTCVVCPGTRASSPARAFWMKLGTPADVQVAYLTNRARHPAAPRTLCTQPTVQPARSEERTG